MAVQQLYLTRPNYGSKKEVKECANLLMALTLVLIDDR
jgi:hypothetical protein